MDNLVMKWGILGFSEGNGHPFSFSAIVNGYDREAFAQAGWPVILSYLEAQPRGQIGLPGIQITAAWGSCPDTTDRLCAACYIPAAMSDPEEMLGKVDAVIIARDDWECHAKLALPFLRAGLPVFIDKPLSLDEAEIAAFEPYLRRGQLLSGSGMRYAKELDELRQVAAGSFACRHINATVLNGLTHYGIHLLEAIAGLGFPPIQSVRRLAANHEAFHLTLKGGLTISLDCLGAVGKTFHLSFFGATEHRHFDLHDNFSAFRRLLEHFATMVRTGHPPFPPEETLHLMEVLRIGTRLRPGEEYIFPGK